MSYLVSAKPLSLFGVEHGGVGALPSGRVSMTPPLAWAEGLLTQATHSPPPPPLTRLWRVQEKREAGEEEQRNGEKEEEGGGEGRRGGMD